MSDAEILAAVRNGTHVLVPRGGEWSVGDFTLDDWEAFEGKRGLMLELTTEQCRAVSVAMLSER